jgi:membrane protease YdiL (CAAX protease family)
VRRQSRRFRKRQLALPHSKKRRKCYDRGGPIMTTDAEIPLPVSLEEPSYAAPQGPSASQFGAAKALLAFFLLLVAQFSAGVFVVVIAMVFAVARGANLNDPSLAHTITGQVTAPLLFAAAAFSTIAAIAVARLWAWPAVFDRSENGVGFARPETRHLIVWTAAGIAISAFYIATAQWIVPPDPSTPMGPLASAASSGGMNRIMWIFLALIFAPLVEEFFFRGLLLKGFSNSWGKWPAAVAVTVLFVSLHLFETYAYWPATVAVVTMAVVAWIARTSSRSLIPPIAMHFGYNLAIVVSTSIALNR